MRRGPAAQEFTFTTPAQAHTRSPARSIKIAAGHSKCETELRCQALLEASKFVADNLVGSADGRALVLAKTSRQREVQHEHNQ